MHGAIADKEWHGTKPELKPYEENAEEVEGEYEEGFEEQQWQGASSGIGFDRFEIEVEDSKSKVPKSPNGKDSVIIDALQRQRQFAKAGV